MIPAVLIAGTHSGVGKTTVTLGLMAALHKRGLEVQPFKVGPDFIDPSHHSAICGRTSRNLDPFMMGLDGVKRSFCSALYGADVAVVEGVMGLFDGMDGSEIGSTAQVAKALDIPVLLVIDVHGMSRSAAALELGFANYDPNVKLAGTILNRTGSERHLAILRSTLKRPIYGSLPQDKNMEMKSRHLGLVMGFEKNHDVDSMAALLEEHTAIDDIMRLCVPTCPAPKKIEDPEKSVRIGIAQDEAFCFYYQENLRELEKRGADLISFSPLRDSLPDVDGLYIGGGYPELHAATLEAAPARRQIKQASEDGMPIYGECGGLMYLGSKIESSDSSYRMVDALPGTTIMTKKLQALGYAKAEIVRSNPIIDMGKIVRGHEFHYSYFDCDKDAHFVYHMLRGKGIKDSWDGMMEHNTLGGYLHAHFYSVSIDRFIDSCKHYKMR